MNVMIVDDEVLTRTNVKYILEAEIPAYTGTTSYMLCAAPYRDRKSVV